MTPDKTAGLAMMVGSALILVTIFFEYQIGWIGVPREADAMPGFVLSEWQNLKAIWSFQMLGHGFLALSYLLLLRHSSGIYASAWGALCLLAILVVVAFGMTVGGYQAALEVYATQPAVFESLRGAVRGLYSPGGMGGIAFFSLVFVIESVRSKGVVGRVRGGVSLGVFVVCLAVGATTALTTKVGGAAWFFLPLVMGFSLVRSDLNQGGTSQVRLS